MPFIPHKRNIKRKTNCTNSKIHWATNCQHKRPQNTSIVETIEEEEPDGEHEVDNINFVLMITQNQRKILLMK